MDNKNITEQIKNILETYICVDKKSSMECFQEICTNLGLTLQFNTLVRLEKIRKNNDEIGELKARNMYGHAASLCQKNAELYASIDKEIQESKNNQNNQSLE